MDGAPFGGLINGGWRAADGGWRVTVSILCRVSATEDPPPLPDGWPCCVRSFGCSANGCNGPVGQYPRDGVALLRCSPLGRASVKGAGRYYGRAPSAVRVLCIKWAFLDPFSPMGKVTAVTTLFPYAPCAGLLRFLLSPKTQIMT